MFIISQSDKPIDTPWRVIVNSVKDLDQKLINAIVYKVVLDVSGATDRILLGQYDLV